MAAIEARQAVWVGNIPDWFRACSSSGKSDHAFGSRRGVRGARKSAYWLLPLPLIWWAMKIARYERGALRFIRHTQVASPILAAGLVGVVAIQSGSITPFVIATLVALVCAAAGWVLYSDSMLQREGTVDE